MIPKHNRWKELPPKQIERAIQGSREDLDALVRWYGPVVWAAVAARVRGTPALLHQVEDLVGSVWLELCHDDWKRLRYYDRARGELGYFLRLQAGQIAWCLVQRQRARLELARYYATPEPPEPPDDLELRVLSRDFLECLALRAKGRLSESDWVVFNATFVEGLTSAELAQRLAKKIETVYQHKSRLRAKLGALARELQAEMPA